MAFLEINGYAFKTRIRGRRRQDRMGSVGRAYSGMAQSDVRTNKNRWRFTTPQVIEKEAEYIRGILLREGHSWPMDSDAYSFTGLGPNSSAQFTVHSENGADGDPVNDVAQFGGSVAVDVASTNICPADARDAENAPTGYIAIGGGVLSANTSAYWQGSKSVQAVAIAPGSGLETISSASGGILNDIVYGSVYLKSTSGSGTINVVVQIFDVTNTVASAASIVSINETTWTRALVTHTLTAASSALRLRVTSQSGSDGFIGDGFQLEINNYTSWVDGARSSADQLVYERVTWLRKPNMTFYFWTQGPSDSASGTTRLMEFGLDSSNYIRINANYTSNNLQLNVADSVGGSVTLTKTSAWDGDWHLVSAVIRNNPETGETRWELYYDGVLADSSSTDLGRRFYSDYTKLSIGCGIDGTAQSNAKFDDVFVLPFPLFAACIDAWYDYGESLAQWPNFYVEGELFDGRTTAQGVDDDEAYAEHSSGGTWRSNGREFQFELWER